MAAEIAPWQRFTAAVTAASLLGGSLHPTADHPPISPLAVNRIVVYEAYGPDGTTMPDYSAPWQEASDNLDLSVVLGAAWQELHDKSNGLIPSGVKVEAAGSIALTGMKPLSSVCEDSTRQEFFNEVTDKVRDEHDIGNQDLLVVSFTPESGSRICDSGLKTASASQYGRNIVIYNSRPFVSGEGLEGQESTLHEYSHAVLDLTHNNMADCEVGGEPGAAIVRVGGACEVDWYGDPYTVQGSRPALKNGHLFHGFELRRLGMIAGNSVESITGHGIHELQLTSLDAEGNGIRLVRVPLSTQALGELSEDISADALYFEFSPAERSIMGIKAYLVNESAFDGDDPEDSYLLPLSTEPLKHSLQSAGQSAELLFSDMRLAIAVRDISCSAADIAVSLVEK